MRNLFLCGLVVVSFVLALLCPQKSDAALLLFNTNLASTNGGAVFQTPIIYLTPVRFLFTSGGITNLPVYQTNVVNGVTNVVNLITNAQQVNIQYSVDPNNSNWVTVATWNPNGTNGETDIPSLPTASNNGIYLYMRAQIVQTNPLSATGYLNQ